jgi:protein-L-isoaspartate(D-aspartate) O-methyltransferase
MRDLIDRLKQLGVLKTPRIEAGFLKNDRRNFVPPELVDDTYEDMPLPIGDGQTISQPYTVAFMLELLEPQSGQRVLDIGSGSGWTTAILASIVGSRGRVTGLEINPAVYKFGLNNLQRTRYKNIELLNQSGWEGYEPAGPYDRILVGAAAPAIPAKLKQQLKIGGVMVIPVGTVFDCSVVRLEKLGGNRFKKETYPGFAFVPFLKKRNKN